MSGWWYDVLLLHFLPVVAVAVCLGYLCWLYCSARVAWTLYSTLFASYLDLFQTKLWSWRGWVNQWHDIDTQQQFAKIVRNVTEAIARLFIQTNSFQCWMTRTNGIQTQITTHDCPGGVRGVRGLPSIVARIFPTNVCRKRQTFLVSDKHLSETTSVCQWNWTLTEKNLRKHIGQHYMICRMKNDKHTFVGICRFFLVFLYTKSVYIGHYN